MQQKVRKMRRRAWPIQPMIGLMLVILLSGCVRTVGSCTLIPLVEYTPEQYASMADAVEALPFQNPIRETMAPDYIHLRRMIRVCRGESVN